MNVVIICEHMHWSYQDYVRAPSWFLDRLEIKLSEEAQYSRAQSKQSDTLKT